MINFDGIELDEDLKLQMEKLFDTSLDILNQNKEDFEVNLQVIESEEMRLLNLNTRNIDYATDVLSYPILEKENFAKKIDKNKYILDVNPETNLLMLGDIYINIDKVREQSEEYGHSYKREFCYLFVHAMLHLMGFDHMEEDDKILMRETEEKILNKYDIKRD